MEKGMTFEDYEYDVKLWMASGLVAKEKQALLLINEFPSIKQGSGTFDKFMTRLRSMKKMAKDEFGFELPQMIMVAKMLQGCSEVTPENIGIITQGIKLESEGQDNLEAMVEASIKQFVTTA